MKKLLFALPIILLLAAGCSSSSTSQPITQTMPTPQQPAAQNPAPTPPSENLKTYTNTPYGFELKYPSIYRVYDASSDSKVEGELFVVNIIGPTKEEINFGPASSISVSVWNNSKQLSLVDWATANSSFSNYSSGSLNTDFKNETLSGHKAISYSWQGQGYGKTVIITNGQNVIMLATGANNKADQVWQDFDSILSTFKFTK